MTHGEEDGGAGRGARAPSDAVDPAFEGRLARGCDDATRIAYAGWLAARGAPARADAVRRHRPAPPVPPLELAFEAEPPDDRLPWCLGPEPPLRILVIADFWGRPDPRPLSDRLRCHGRDPYEFLLGDGAPEGAPDERPAWRALRWLMDHVPEGTRIEPLNATPADLVFDLEDAPSLRQSFVYMTVNDRNHPGMAPYFAVVLDFPLDRVADAHLLGQLAEMGRQKDLPILVPTNEGFADEAAPPVGSSRDAPEARYLAFCAPSFVLERKGTSTVTGPASFLVAALLARGWARFGGGGDLRGALEVELTQRVAPSQAILAAERGVLAFVDDAGGARLFHDATFGGGPSPMSRSLSWLFLATRLALRALRVHEPRGDGPHDLSAEGTAASIEEKLALRLRPVPDVRVALHRARWAEEPTLLGGWVELAGRLEVELELTVEDEAGERLSLREPLCLRLGT